MVVINKRLLPIKAHYFFFMAAMGPILPQITVYGKQLGISVNVMGLVTSVLPICYFIAKPLVGFLIDYFRKLRKIIFMLIIVLMTLSFAGFYFVPMPAQHRVPQASSHKFLQNKFKECNDSQINYPDLLCSTYKAVNCKTLIRNHNRRSEIKNYTGYLTIITPDPDARLDYSNSEYVHTYETYRINYDLCVTDLSSIFSNDSYVHRYVSYEVSCETNGEPDNCVIGTITFWSFISLLCLGVIGFNVGNCVSDAICFDMLGEQNMNYGAQRVWGTVGFGMSALIGGIVGHSYKIDTMQYIVPAIFVMVAFSAFDVFTISWLKLPQLSSSTSILTDVKKLLRQKSIIIFLIFATVVGIMDSFIMYYMFWHLEEVAIGYESSTIKLIEGCVVAAECLGGEILFFLISGTILKRIGYVNCLSVCFIMYAIRLGLLSFLDNPWYFVVVELFMQGPTYALCYTCIVAYASAISPAGTTGTVQGLVAGMDDGLGFAIGSLVGGQLYQRFGGAKSFQIFSICAIIVALLHVLITMISQTTEKLNVTDVEKKADLSKCRSSQQNLYKRRISF